MFRSPLPTLVALALVAPFAEADKKPVREAAPVRVSAKPAVLSRQDCERFALAFEEAVRTKDWKGAEAGFDWNALYARATNGIPAPDKTRSTFKSTADSYFRGQDGLVGGVVQSVAKGGTFRFLRTVERNGETRVLFRQTQQSGDVPDYITVVLAPGEGGGAVAVDIESTSEGDLASSRLRRYFLDLAAGATRNLEEKVRGVDQLRVHWQKELDRAGEAFRGGQNKQALEILEALPEELKNDRSIALERLNAARAVSKDVFLVVLGRVRNALPGDAASERIALDYFLETKAHAQARRSALALDQAVGGDGYATWLAAIVAEEAGDLAGAVETCRLAIERDESLQEPWWTLVEIYLRQARHADTLAALEGLAARFEVDWRKIENAAEFQAFFASEPGKTWKSRVPKR